MQMNTWYLSEVLTSIEDIAMYDDYIYAVEQCVKSFKGFDLLLEYDIIERCILPIMMK